MTSDLPVRTFWLPSSQPKCSCSHQKWKFLEGSYQTARQMGKNRFCSQRMLGQHKTCPHHSREKPRALPCSRPGCTSLISTQVCSTLQHELCVINPAIMALLALCDPCYSFAFRAFPGVLFSWWGYNGYFFKNHLFFIFRFTEKLRGRQRFPIFFLPLHIHSFPFVHIPNHGGIFDTLVEPTLIHGTWSP